MRGNETETSAGVPGSRSYPLQLKKRRTMLYISRMTESAESGDSDALNERELAEGTAETMVWTVVFSLVVSVVSAPVDSEDCVRGERSWATAWWACWARSGS